MGTTFPIPTFQNAEMVSMVEVPLGCRAISSVGNCWTYFQTYRLGGPNVTDTGMSGCVANTVVAQHTSVCVVWPDVYTQHMHYRHINSVVRQRINTPQL